MDFSLFNQHYHAVPVMKLCLWANRFFKIVGFAGKHFLSLLALPLFILFCAFTNFHVDKKRKRFKPAESPTEMLATQATMSPLFSSFAFIPVQQSLKAQLLSFSVLHIPTWDTICVQQYTYHRGTHITVNLVVGGSWSKSR